MDTKTLITASIGLFCLSIASNVAITNYMQTKQLEVIVETLDTPKVKVVDMDKLVEKLTKDGLAPTEVLAYVDNINKAMRLKNVLLIDSKALIVTPEHYKLDQVTPPDLAAFLKSHGTVPSEASAFQKNLDEAQSLVQFPVN